MADLSSRGNPDRDAEQALIALKKGSQIIKYSRKGKPKVRLFRLSADETTLIWFSHKKEKSIKLASVSKIIPGQRTAVFKRFLRPEKDYLSFSLIYKNGERSLDLICRDQTEAEAWFAGLKALITPGQGRNSRTNGQSDGLAFSDLLQTWGGFRTLKVVCGVWHSAAIVEVNQTGVNVVSRKLFTWGDGDKHRLGHGDKEARLIPTCVPSLIDYNFHQLACGQTMTVGLTTFGHVFTMGSTNYGQLGNPQSDGKVPCLVQDRLVGELIEEISCGADHVAVLTSRSEVYTWDRGANGRLGHGDVEDRKTPTLVEALKDRHVKSISCGSNFTACICIHKWVSSAEQSVCSGCRQAFGFTRKRHNCYNCGLVHCHACSSRKVLKAALAPTPGKPHRVCDSCFMKLKASEASNAAAASRRNIITRRSIDTRERLDRPEVRTSRLLLSPSTEPVKYVEVRSVKNELKTDSLSLIRASQVPSLLQLKDLAFPSSLSALQTALRPIVTSTPAPANNNIPASPYPRRPSPPPNATPMYSKSVIDSLKKTNELLNQEVLKLQAQVKSLRHKSEIQDEALQKCERKANKAASLAAEESAKCNAALGLVKSFESQLKDAAEKLPPEFGDNVKALQIQAESLLKDYKSQALKISPSLAVDLSENYQHRLSNDGAIDISERTINNGDELQNPAEGSGVQNNHSAVTEIGGVTAQQYAENGSKVPMDFAPKFGSQGEVQLIEQFEPGVYVTLIQLRDGTKVFKRVRFRLLTTLSQALQNSGLDLSQASISVQINLGKHAANKRSASVSTSNPKMCCFALEMSSVGGLWELGA